MISMITIRKKNKHHGEHEMKSFQKCWVTRLGEHVCEVDAIVHGETDDDHTSNALRSTYAPDKGKREVCRCVCSSHLPEKKTRTLTESSCDSSNRCGESCPV